MLIEDGLFIVKVKFGIIEVGDVKMNLPVGCIRVPYGMYKLSQIHDFWVFSEQFLVLVPDPSDCHCEGISPLLQCLHVCKFTVLSEADLQ